MNTPRNQNDDDYDTRRHLGFKLQDRVTISNRFFQDHGMKPIYLGVGIIVAKILPTPNNLPALIVEMPIHSMMLTNEHFRKLIIPTEQQEKKRGTIMLKIHPLYIELNETKKDGKKTKR